MPEKGPSVGNCPNCGAPIYYVKHGHYESPGSKDPDGMPIRQWVQDAPDNIRFTCPCHEWLQRDPNAALAADTILTQEAVAKARREGMQLT